MTMEKLITAKQAGQMLGLDAKTVLAGKSETEDLTRVPMGKRDVRFVESEVQALVLNLIAEARKVRAQAKAMRGNNLLTLVPPTPEQVKTVISKYQR